MNDLLESGAADRRGQEWGVEGNESLPPATNELLKKQQADVEVRQCEMYEFDYGGDRCRNTAMEASYFCAECAGLKLCKTSGIWHFNGGQNGKAVRGLITFGEHIPPHPIDLYPRTKRAQFCCDRCRNLWRDTKQRRECRTEVAKIENGARSERYALISNYCNSGQNVLLDKQTSRIVGRFT